jgi:glucose-6-phosphate dehydrogenase assembly protein OpcA
MPRVVSGYRAVPRTNPTTRRDSYTTGIAPYTDRAFVMPNATPLETFTAGSETAVDVARVERQLRELWQLAAESQKGQITRASLLNLVAYTETDAARDHATEVISSLTSRHPCRAIVLLCRASGPLAAGVNPTTAGEPPALQLPDELSASITAHCHLAGGGGKQVCCEQISIHASGKSVAHVAAAVLPLLESDLPTVVWWQGNFLLRPDPLKRLSTVADRIFFDTSLWPDAEQYLPALSRTIEALRGCSFADLSWTRLGLWRRLAAEAFDEPHCRAMLPAVRTVKVEHGRGEGARLRARLLGSWFAAQVGWTPAAARDRVQLIARDAEDAAHVGILSFTMTGDNVEVRVFKSHGERTASAVVNVPDACGLPRKRAFWPKDDASLLSQELDRAAPHKIYERALALAAAL